MCVMCDNFSRRDFLKLTAVLTAGTALPLIMQQQARAADEPDAPVRVGYLPVTDAAPLLVAHAQGRFDQPGKPADKPVMFRSWSQLTEAFIAGQVNVIHMLAPVTLWARYQAKLPAKVVAWNHTNGSALTVLPEITDARQLSGKIVAIPFWYSIHNVIMQQLLREAGLKAVTGTAGQGEVQLVVMSPADMVPALVSRKISGFIVAEPFNALAESHQVGRILRFTGDIWKNHACCVVMMHESDLNNRPEWSQQVTDAIVDAQHWIRSNRSQTATLLSRDGPNHYTPHTAEVLNQVLQPSAGMESGWIADHAIHHPDWHQSRIDFQPWPYAGYFTRLAELLKQTVIEGDHSFLQDLQPQNVSAELTDNRYVLNSIRKAGGMSAFGLADDNYQRTEVISP